MPIVDDVNRVLRDHVGYSGDGQGGIGALPVGDRTTARKPIDKRDLRQILVNIGSAVDEGAGAGDASTPAYYGAPMNGTDSDSDAIDAAIAGSLPVYYGTEAIRFLHFTAGNYLITRGVALPSNIFVTMDAGTHIRLGDFAYANMFYPAQARAMRRDTAFGTDDLGNPFPNDSGIRAAVAAYEGAASAGDIVQINGFEYEAMGAAHEYYDAIPPEMRGTRGDGLRFRPAMARNIYIKALGKTVLDGNGINNRVIGAGPRYRERMINFGFCKDFHVEGLTLKNGASWAISNEHVDGGTYKDITVDHQGWMDRTIPLGDPGWRSEPGLPNQDGLNLRKGCRNIIVDGLFGQSGDDGFALTNLYAVDDSFPERDNHFSSNWAPYGSETLAITARRLFIRPIGSHGVFRALSSDENLIRFVNIDASCDFTNEKDVIGNAYFPRVAPERWAVIGDGRYGDMPSSANAIRDINIYNLTTTASVGLKFKGPSRNVTVDGLRMMYDSKLGAFSSTAPRVAIMFAKGILHQSQAMIDATQTNPVSIMTASEHGLTTGTRIIITGCYSMVEINNTMPTVTVTGPTTYTLDGVDGTSFAPFVPGSGDTDDHARAEDYLEQSDHTFLNVNFGVQSAANGGDAGYLMDVRDGSYVKRCTIGSPRVFSARSLLRVVSTGTKVTTLAIKDPTVYITTGPLLDVYSSADHANCSGSITGFTSHGRKFNTAGLDGPVDRAYSDRWFLKLDATCPDVTADDVEPPAIAGSEVYFNSNTGRAPVRTLFATRSGQWVYETRAYGQPVHCAVVSQAGDGSIALSSGMNMVARPVGQRISFIPPATNTGGFGITLDGSAVAVRTDRGAGTIPPAGYLRAGWMTEAWFDGTYWIVGRADEYISGTDADGYTYRAVRYATGQMDIYGSILMNEACDIVEGSQFVSNSVTKTYPLPFTHFARARVEMGASAVHRDVVLSDITTVEIKSWANATDAGTTDVVPYSATGFWF